MHRSKDRAKDASPSHMHGFSCLRRVHTLCGACATAFPSSASFGHPLSPARHLLREEPATLDGPTKTFVPPPPREGRRLPEDQDAFHRYDTRRSSYAEGLLPPAFAPALSLTPPARLHEVEGVLMGLARSRCGHPRVRESREYSRLFNPLEPSRLGLTTQARQRARPARPSTGTDCPARTDAGRSA